MKLLICANVNDISKVQKLFSTLTRVKGTYPKIKNLHDFINSRKYLIDPSEKSGGINKDYPANVLHDICDTLKLNDIVIIPIDNKLIKAIRNYKKIKNLFLYEEDNLDMPDFDEPDVLLI